MLSAAEKQRTSVSCSGITRKETQSLALLQGHVSDAILNSADITREIFVVPALLLKSRAKTNCLGYLIYED
jgi:hypothetical protein